MQHPAHIQAHLRACLHSCAHTHVGGDSSVVTPIIQSRRGVGLDPLRPFLERCELSGRRHWTKPASLHTVSSDPEPPRRWHLPYSVYVCMHAHIRTHAFVRASARVRTIIEAAPRESVGWIASCAHRSTYIHVLLAYEPLRPPPFLLVGTWHEGLLVHTRVVRPHCESSSFTAALGEPKNLLSTTAFDERATAPLHVLNLTSHLRFDGPAS